MKNACRLKRISGIIHFNISLTYFLHLSASFYFILNENFCILGIAILEYNGIYGIMKIMIQL